MGSTVKYATDEQLSTHCRNHDHPTQTPHTEPYWIDDTARGSHLNDEFCCVSMDDGKLQSEYKRSQALVH